MEFTGEMMKLYVLNDYKNRQLSYQAGDEIEVDPDVAAYLVADAPGSFAYEPPIKGLDEPPKDKAVKRAPRKKAKNA
jgi:hypothetical protein